MCTAAQELWPLGSLRAWKAGTPLHMDQVEERVGLREEEEEDIMNLRIWGREGRGGKGEEFKIREGGKRMEEKKMEQ